MSGAAELLWPLESWMADPTVSEILLNHPGEIWVEQEGKLKQHALPLFDVVYLERLFRLIANENHQVISRQQPLLSGSLPDGSRVQLCLPPVSQFPVFAIRRQTVKKIKLADYDRQGFYDQVRAVSCDGQQNSDSGDQLLYS